MSRMSIQSISRARCWLRLVGSEAHAVDTVVRTAGAQIASKQYDAAYTTIHKYVSFAGEEPRLKQIVDAAYKFHLDKG